jgi:hypothetical protein
MSQTPSPPPDEGSPFDTETIKYMAGDELLAVRLRDGARVARDRVALEVAGAFLGRLDAAVYAMAGSILGRNSGSRGPLKRIEIGGLALAGVSTGGSADFHFKLQVHEQSQIGPEGEVIIATTAALDGLSSMLESLIDRDDERLLSLTRDFGSRAAANFGRLLDVLSANEIETVWRFGRDSRALVTDTAALLHGKVVLERTAQQDIDMLTVRGLLYEADSRRHIFEIAVEDGAEEDKIRGTFSPEQREEIRYAWDRRVEAEIRVTRIFLERQLDAFETKYELMRVLRVLDDAE